jgi:flavodoxin I
MSKTIVVYGSSTGTCEAIAQTIGEKLGANVINVSDLTANDVKEADNLVLGTSSWGAGEMQDDWYNGVKVLKEAGLSGKKVAVFGCGDSESYSDTFCGGMKELYDAAEAAGATMVGNNVSTDGYTFDDSESVVDGHFIGLALDDVNEDDKTEERINAWIPTLGF